jgi:adenosylmethionine-8-amino-7-oxononanoate aminotransferase
VAGGEDESLEGEIYLGSNMTEPTVSMATLEHFQTDYLFYQTRRELPFIDRAEGIYIWDHRGKKYLDGSSGAITCNIGHGNHRVANRLADQSRKAVFAYRTQFENAPAHRYAAALVEHLAPHLQRIFFVSSGSEAVEAAIKLCRQYFFNRGEKQRIQFISRRPSYHGSTLGALSLTSYAPLEIPFRPMIHAFPKIQAPCCYHCAYHRKAACSLQCAWELEKVIQEQGPDSIAGFVAEPIGGASTGAVVPPPKYFSVIQEICKKYGIFLILDEVMTGFGRTGRLFAYEHWNIDADIVVMSKGMTAGYYPLGGIAARTEYVEEMLQKGGFAHGHTLAGNPMGCAVGLEVLDIILENHLPENAARMGRVLKQGLERLKQRYAFIGQVRGRGLLMAIELVRDPKTREPFPPERNAHFVLTDEAYDEGLIVYPRRSINGLSGDHVMIAPPLIITRDQVGELLERLDRALARTQSKLT